MDGVRSLAARSEGAAPWWPSLQVEVNPLKSLFASCAQGHLSDRMGESVKRLRLGAPAVLVV